MPELGRGWMEWRGRAVSWILRNKCTRTHSWVALERPDLVWSRVHPRLTWDHSAPPIQPAVVAARKKEWTASAASLLYR